MPTTNPPPEAWPAGQAAEWQRQEDGLEPGYHLIACAAACQPEPDLPADWAARLARQVPPRRRPAAWVEWALAATALPLLAGSAALAQWFAPASADSLQTLLDAASAHAGPGTLVLLAALAVTAAVPSHRLPTP